MGERIRAFDWASHPLGPPEQWPQALLVALGICLNSTFPTAIYWGRELWLLYNDAWSEVPRERHPWALGQRGGDVWKDIWGVVGPQFADVLDKGGAVTQYDQLLPMERDGVVREEYWTYSLSPILDADGAVAGVFNQGHETTAVIMAARAREAETERLRELFAQAPGAIAVLRGENHVFDIANAAYIELVGGRANLIGRPLAEALPEVVEQGFVELLDEVYRTGEPFIGDDVPVDLIRDGRRETRILDFIYQPTRDVSGSITGVFVQATDVTQYAQLVQQMQALNATLEDAVRDEVAERMRAEQALRQAQKMESIGQLTGGIAHDFNNMLAVVIGALNLLQRRLARGDTDVSRFVEAAQDGAQRAASLTQRLLAFSRQQPLDPAPLDASALVVSMTELLGRTLGEHIRIETKPTDAVWTTYVDRVQLESTILNLAVNARDAMPEGGMLRIVTANESVKSAYVEEKGIPAGDYVVITVQDTGVGMTADIARRAFDPFFTTKEVGKGTGLGLSQVFGFVQQSGGEVKLQSEPGVGTTVQIFLPRYFGEVAEAEEAGENRHARLATGEIVLVVEDDERVRNFSTEALRELGYTVLAAPGGPQALRLLEEQERVDLLFTDMVMPDMNGRQLADAARERWPGLKVLFTTGYMRNPLLSESVADPGALTLYKPFTVEQLAEKVRAALGAAT